MRIVGEWLLCTDGETRPVVKAHVADASGGEVEERFLGLPSSPPPAGIALSGVGSRPAFVVVRTTLTLTTDAGSAALFQGEFAAFTDPAAADMSILGREILDHFDVILSRRRNEVLLLATNHQYRVEHVP
jgi:hypothetical protein